MRATPWQDTAPYHAYVEAQAEKTTRMQHTIAWRRLTRLVGQLVRADRRSPLGRSVLSVGCRNSYELGLLHAVGFEPVVGIDLVSPSPEVTAMDMHQMTFADDQFDVLFSCHNLEHAYDLEAALTEWHRVTKSGGTWAIEVPTGFPPTEVDRHDLGSLAGLRQAVAPYLETVLFAEASRALTVARLIGRVK